MKLCFPCTNRVHLARQQILLRELRKFFDVDIVEYQPKYKSILNNVADTGNYFRKVIEQNSYDLVIIRGDRFEMLPIAMLCAYRGLRIAHIEGGDLSGAIDNKVRHAITELADIHFATNEESKNRLLNMGTNPKWTFNFGSLDVSYAKSVPIAIPLERYVVICHHPMPGENPAIIEKIIREEFDGKVIVIKSNFDNGTIYGSEEYSPDDYIRLIANARCLIGNSSSFLKEASIFGTPVVNIGDRQFNRLTPHNVKNTPFNEEQIRRVLKEQLKATYLPSHIYYQEGTSLNITNEIKRFLLTGY